MIKNILPALLAGAVLAAASSPALAAKKNPEPAAPAATGIVAGIAVASLDAVIANSSAFTTAQNQRPVTYKPQLDAAEARRKAIATQLQPLYEKFQRESQVAAPNRAALQAQAETIRGIEQSGQQELQGMLQPVALSEAFVQEQIEDKLDQAVKNAMKKKGVTLLLNPQAIIAVNDNAYNLNQDVLNELNTLLPSAMLVPPQGWEPRQVREQRAAQAAAQGGQAPAAAPAASAGPQVDGR
ncbi:MAG: hypothetical protein RIQ46_1577 [Pseudomonadota bacterium]|jgi:Skp family chaperone for outer membrane proteins